VSLFMYVDNSSVLEAGRRLGAVRQTMADSVADRTWDIDYGRLHHAVSQGNSIAKASLFGPAPPSSDSLWAMCTRRGIEVVSYLHESGVEETGVAVAIAGRMVQDACNRMRSERADLAVLVSGDQALVPAVEILAELGVRTMVVFWEDDTSPVLRAAADDFFPLDDMFDYVASPTRPPRNPVRP
jgi:hypothetical protein